MDRRVAFIAVAACTALPVGAAPAWAADGPAQKAPSAATAKSPAADARSRQEALEKLDLDKPLVDDPELKRLEPDAPIWINGPRKKVVLVGAVCQRESPLELFACLSGSKEYESVVAVRARASTLHAALVAIGLEPGAAAEYGDTFTPARGPVVEITLIWNDEQGRRRNARAQDWIRSLKTGKPMNHPFVFVGSRFHEGPDGQRVYAADVTGDLICVTNFPDAVLDIPVQSTDDDASLLFQSFTEHIPPRGTPVTLVLSPREEKKPASR